MSAGVRPGALDRVGGGRGAERRRGLAGPGDAALADTGALDDPRVVRVDARFEIGVGHAPSGTAVPQPTIAELATAVTRRATTRPAVRRAVVRRGARACPSACRANGLRTGSLVPGPSTTPTIVADARPSRPRRRVDADGTRRRRARRSCARARRAARRAMVGTIGGGHVRCPRRKVVRIRRACRTASTGTSGTVRLATPAIIEPWPTSTNASAPRPASVSIDVRQRTGTVT